MPTTACFRRKRLATSRITSDRATPTPSPRSTRQTADPVAGTKPRLGQQSFQLASGVGTPHRHRRVVESETLPSHRGHRHRQRRQSQQGYQATSKVVDHHPAGRDPVELAYRRGDDLRRQMVETHRHDRHMNLPVAHLRQVRYIGLTDRGPNPVHLEALPHRVDKIDVDVRGGQVDL